jgi:hypothetical protein
MNYSVYRCPDPIKTETNTPWYRIEDKCPCNPADSNVTGRGFTPCSFGVQFETPNQINLAKTRDLPKQANKLVGTLYENNQFVPPQLQPRQLARIGQQWRSAN